MKNILGFQLENVDAENFVVSTVLLFGVKREGTIKFRRISLPVTELSCGFDDDE